MRSFRDNWLKKQPFGESEIQKYYATAPKIVAAINARMDSQKIYKEIYDNYLYFCISCAEKGDNETAYCQYKYMVTTLAERYLKETE